jgi:hypothetical protein
MRSGLALAGHCRIAILGHRRAGVGFFLEGKAKPRPEESEPGRSVVSYCRSSRISSGSSASWRTVRMRTIFLGFSTSKMILYDHFLV